MKASRLCHGCASQARHSDRHQHTARSQTSIADVSKQPHSLAWRHDVGSRKEETASKPRRHNSPSLSNASSASYACDMHPTKSDSCFRCSGVHKSVDKSTSSRDRGDRISTGRLDKPSPKREPECTARSHEVLPTQAASELREFRRTWHALFGEPCDSSDAEVHLERLAELHLSFARTLHQVSPTHEL